jgi:SAM-dependent methyltransferase
MLPVKKQIAEGRLVCPATHQTLIIKSDHLETVDGSHRYSIKNGIPILFANLSRQAQYLNENNGAMEKEYNLTNPVRKKLRYLFRSLSTFGGDHRSKNSRAAFQQAIAQQPPETLCLAIGGGPARAHPKLVNLNIGLFPNVDIVADAYELPYADNSVDAIYCEAVLEHLEFPDNAVSEMWRVLKPGGQIFAATPFLQKYHGYPNHFQNFTLTGHQRLFERAGFTILSAGASVGPTYALSILTTAYALTYLPTKLLQFLVASLIFLIYFPLRILDRWINEMPGAHRLASTTYVHATKSY